jgi:hypothetical protein
MSDHARITGNPQLSFGPTPIMTDMEATGHESEALT